MDISKGASMRIDCSQMSFLKTLYFGFFKNDLDPLAGEAINWQGLLLEFWTDWLSQQQHGLMG